jgi:tetrahydromethanopterin S-methyltransferase subunit B
MKKFMKPYLRTFLTAAFLTVTFFRAGGQSAMPDELTNGSVKEQLKYLEEHTRIYENYRAIREDMFQKLKQNVSDTLTAANKKISMLNGNVAELKTTIDTLRSDLNRTKTNLETVTTSKNSISLLGIEVNKLTYNTVMWLIILGLAAALVIGFLIFKRNIMKTSTVNMELDELKEEFQAYRKTTREAREKMAMDHFNEIKRMKGG